MAVKNVKTTTQSVSTSTSSQKKAANYSAIDQFIYLIFGIIEFLLAMRFVFRMLGANPAAGIVSFIYAITNVLMVPFNFIFPPSQVEGAYFEWSVVVAILFYALFAWVIGQLIRILYTADTAN